MTVRWRAAWPEGAKSGLAEASDSIIIDTESHFIVVTISCPISSVKWPFGRTSTHGDPRLETGDRSRHFHGVARSCAVFDSARGVVPGEKTRPRSCEWERNSLSSSCFLLRFRLIYRRTDVLQIHD
jgi:hypothetical protein